MSASNIDTGYIETSDETKELVMGCLDAIDDLLRSRNENTTIAASALMIACAAASSTLPMTDDSIVSEFRRSLASFRFAGETECLGKS